MVLFTITPWRHHGELLDVRDSFYPQHSGIDSSVGDDHRRRAVARVGIWVNRGNCPHLVESTAVLTAVCMDDAASKGQTSSAFTIRHAYALAFSRFVTGLLDSCQDKAHKLSMFSVAKNIGLPDTFVELRHQITHEGLPALPVLREATEMALSWIWGFYWKTLETTPVLSKEEESCLKTMQRCLDKVQRGEKLNLSAVKENLKMFSTDEKLASLSELDYGDGASRQSQSLKFLSAVLTPTAIEKVGAEADARAGYLQKLRQEMEDMETELRTDVGTRGAVKAGNGEPEESTSPWSMWEGPWTPKPIGMI